MKGDYDFEVRLKLRREDVLELRRLQDRARKESRVFVLAHDTNWSSLAAARFTDTSRDAQRSLETLERILEQIR